MERDQICRKMFGKLFHNCVVDFLICIIEVKMYFDLMKTFSLGCTFMLRSVLYAEFSIYPMIV